MIFNSVTFLLFLLIVVPLYWLLPTVIRLWALFVASLVFYGFWRFDFLIVMLLSAAVDYFTSIAIDETPKSNISRRRWLLALTLFINLGLLFYFKYLFFFCENTNSLLEAFGLPASIPVFKILLPFGISFYTFETISYTIDVYRGIIKPERKFIHYALFVTFFPKLVAGPIQRANELLPQLKNRVPFQLDFLNTGLRRIIYGLFIKVFLADSIGGFVDSGFALETAALSAIDVLTLAFLFGFQIYFDFAGYSHIALGTAKLMGIDIPENFNFPYIASSLKDFWKRWHISLSAWIKDYLYLPLTGTRVTTTSGRDGIGSALPASSGGSRTMALFLTWSIMGLWHGASWTFLVWGVFHATIIFVERIIGRIKFPLPLAIQATICHFFTLGLVMISWIPFRATSLNQTFAMWEKLFRPEAYFRYGLHENNYILAAIILASFYVNYWGVHCLAPQLRRAPFLKHLLEVVMLAMLIVFVFTFLRPISQFIYFQF